MAGDRLPTVCAREIVPVLARPILTECGLGFISAVYLMATVSFLGAGEADSGFVWSTMVSENLPGLPLNPWACLAPVAAIVALTVPLSLLVDETGATAETHGTDGTERKR